MNTHATALRKAADAAAAFVGPIQDLTFGIEMYSGAQKTTATTSTILENGIEVLNGTASRLATTFGGAATRIISFDDAMKTTITDAKTFTDHLNSVANAAQTVGSAVQSVAKETSIAGEAFAGMAAGAGDLGKALDKAMSAKLGTISVGLKPGDQYSAYRTGYIEGVNYGGTETGAPFGSALFGPAGLPETMTFDPAAYAQQLQQTNQNLNTAATNLTDAAQTQLDAANAAADAAKMASVAAQAGSTAASSINASALAAADAANQLALNNAGFASVIANTNTVAVTAIQAVAAATNTMAATAQVVTSIANKAGIPLAYNSMIGATGTTVSLPNVGPGSGISGANTGGLPFAPPVFQSGPQSNVTVNVNGSQFVQNLMNEFVRNLQTQGIRLTRG